MAVAQNAAPQSRTPVVVELFTSEGCSSCPPADALLARMDHEQPVSTAEIIVLEEHVDYWEKDGWHDRFSSSQYTERQNGYVPRLKFDSAYTPQMVVDGSTQFVGNDGPRAYKAVVDAAQTPKITLALSPPVLDGRHLAEMYDMRQSGAVAFSDGINTIQSPGILLKALQYVKAFDGTVFQLPDDKSINTQGLINEGIISTQLGLPGKPAIAEELMIARDIELLRYTDSKLHITGVSTQKGIELIAKAKADGLNISCSVTPYHIYFCDEDLQGYDTNLKVNPPLRKKEDILAIKNAVLSGVVDCIASHHLPQDWDNKACEFEYAKNGMGGLESVFGAVNVTYNDKETIGKIIEMLTVNPRKMLGLNVPEIRTGATACITLFNTDEAYIFDEKMIRSKSKNYGFIGKQLKGKVIGIINGTKTVLN